MSAPIAVDATAGLTRLRFTLFINIKSVVGGGACGDVGEGEYFPASRASSESGGSAAGRRRRSSIYPQAFLVHLPRRAITEALVLTLLIVKTEPGADAGPGLGDGGIGIEVDFFVFEAAPQPLDKDVVHAAALAVHTDLDPMVFQSAGEVVTGELAALIGIKDLWPAIAGECFLKRFDAKIGAERVGQPPRQHGAADPIHDRYRVEEAFGHRDVGDVGAPDLIDPLDSE